MNWEKFISDVPKGSRTDKIIGMIYGHALGDAVGLITEFKWKRDKPKIEFPYSESIREFPVNDWTDDTDHLILVMQSMIDNQMRINSVDMAHRLRSWVTTGFAELGDTRGMGLGGTMNMVITHKKFLETPEIAANEIWHNSGKKLAANGSLMRTSIIGSVSDPMECESFARQLSMITHADPRCVASCVMQSLIVGNFINGNITSAISVDKILGDAVSRAREHIMSENEPVLIEDMRLQVNPTFKTRDDELSHWVETAYTKSISELRLDDMVKIGFVFKCLACSVYALQVIKTGLKNNAVPSFKKFILKVVGECGDADTNAAVAGATMGAYLGYSRLPSDWISALPNRDWLNNIIMQFITADHPVEPLNIDHQISTLYVEAAQPEAVQHEL